MSEFTQPAEIAREVLKRLAMKRTQPTPDNYIALYHEIAGTSAMEIFPEKSLKSLAAALPRNTPEQSRFARQFDSAVGEKSWETLKSSLLGFATAAGAEPPPWATLIRELVLQLERSHAGLTPVKKREALERMLKSSAAPDLLFTRLQSLIRSWAQGKTAETEPSLVDGDESSASAEPATPAIAGGQKPAPGAGAASASDGGELRELLAQLLENSIAQLLADSPIIVAEATKLAAEVRNAKSPDAIARLAAVMKKFGYRLNFVAEDQTELRTGLLNLFHLLIDNISELVIDDKNLHGQIAVLLELSRQPLDLRRIDDVERRLKEVIFKQGALKKHLTDAQDRLKAMLATFVDRLSDFSESTSSYQDTIERCVERIGQASDISQLSDVIGEVMRETRTIQLSAQRSRDELSEMKARVDATDKEVERLQQELAETSEMIRIDPLTGALNRRGMDEALEREVARNTRRDGKLCVALLDIDNFKRLNDTFGHKVGDDTLSHLAGVIRETLRPQDTLARYGGEEFLILLPETSLDAAIQTLTRLQRELTRKYFMHDNQKMLITFSAGAAELGSGESAPDAVKRADAAMYLAKRAGKNRVVAA